MLTAIVDWRTRASAPVTASEFSKSVAGALAAMRPDLTCHPAQYVLHLRTTDGHAWAQDLAQAYEIYRGQPALLDSLVRLVVASICDRAILDAANVGGALDELLPVVRRREALANSDVLFAPFGRSLAETFVLDHSGGQTLVTEAMQERLTSSVAALRDAARNNLTDRLGEVNVERLGNDVSLVSSATLPASSLLFSHVFWRLLPPSVEPLFAVPADAHTLVVFEGHKVRDRAIATALEIMDGSASPLTTEVVAIADLQFG